MKLNTKLIIGFIILIALNMSYVLYDQYTSPKQAYVVINELYEGFDMKKELEVKYNRVVAKRKKTLDSLDFVVRQLSILLERQGVSDNEKLSRRFQFEKKKYLSEVELNNNICSNLKYELQQKALKQMNESVKKYGRNYGYDMIFGAKGDGSLLYANDQSDITENVIVFINKIYNGYE